MQAEGAIHDDPVLVKESVAKWTEFDAQENVFAMIAHDASLFDVVEFYPQSANGWRGKGWKTEGRWRFLRDFNVTAEGEESKPV